MKIELAEINDTLLAEIISDKIEIKNSQDAIDIMMNCVYQGAEKIIIRKENLIPDFFDLKTKIAGEILQKFSTYRVKLAIIGDFENITSKSLKDFIHESNKAGNISFVNSLENAREILSK
jgi:hypothetical protein